MHFTDFQDRRMRKGGDRIATSGPMHLRNIIHTFGNIHEQLDSIVSIFLSTLFYFLLVSTYNSLQVNGLATSMSTIIPKLNDFSTTVTSDSSNLEKPLIFEAQKAMPLIQTLSEVTSNSSDLRKRAASRNFTYASVSPRLKMPPSWMRELNRCHQGSSRV
jgi:hypothetical protein